MSNRPISVTIISLVLITSGLAGLAYHATDFKTLHPFPYDWLGIEFVRLLAIVAGAFMLRGSNWARWLALAWIAFHVVISIFHSLSQLAVHCVVFAVFAWALFRPAAREYFRRN